VWIDGVAEDRVVDPSTSMPSKTSGTVVCAGSANDCAICASCAVSLERSAVVERIIAAFAARRQLGKVLNDVTAKGDRFVV
jgi:hypothetical protein